MEDKLERIKEINIENYIWIIYIGIILLSWYSNYKEKEYIIYNDLDSKRIYRNILILIFIILVIVYAYFAYDSYNSVINLKDNDSDEKKNLTYLAFIGSVLVLISGIIFLSIAIKDENIDTEIAFN